MNMFMRRCVQVVFSLNEYKGPIHHSKITLFFIFCLLQGVFVCCTLRGQYGQGIPICFFSLSSEI